MVRRVVTTVACVAAVVVAGLGPGVAGPVAALPPGPVAAAGAPAGVHVDPDSGIGVNLSALVDWSDEDPFLDRFRLSREWIPQCRAGVDPGCTEDLAWDTGERVEVDGHGWVTRVPAPSDPVVHTRVSTLLMVAGTPHNDYAGQYAVRYAGTGRLEYALGARRVSGGPGRDVIEVATDGFALLTITATDPADPIRDIVVVRLQDEQRLGTDVFDQTWLARIAPFRTLRFMDWMRTNGSPRRDLADLPSTDDARWTAGAGAPPEIMAAVADVVGAQPWFTMPHLATDAYVTRFATIVHERLAPGLRVYVEHSNEVWNSAFPQAADVEAAAVAEFDGPDSGFTKRMNQHGRRTVEVCRLWREAFGVDGDRVVCVLGAQAANPYTATEALDCPLWRDDPDNPRPGASCQAQGIDAVAIAPYVGGYLGDPALADQVRGLSLDRLFAELLDGGVLRDPSGAAGVPAGGALAQAAGWLAAYDDLAVERSLPVLAYEGGQHLVGVGAAGDDEVLTDLFVAANRDPRMGEVYRRHLRDWAASPRRQDFVAFSLASRYGRYGSWGLLEHIEQPSSAKYDAVLAAAGQPCWWPACPLGAIGASPSPAASGTPAPSGTAVASGTPVPSPVASGTPTPSGSSSGGGSPGDPSGGPGSGAGGGAPDPGQRVQRPVHPLGLPARLRAGRWSRLVAIPVTTNAGRRAAVAVRCHVAGRRGIGCGRDLRVDHDGGFLRVRVDARRPVVVRVRVRAPAGDGYAAMDLGRRYRVVVAP